MSTISVLEVFDKALIDQVGAYLPAEEAADLFEHLQIFLKEEIDRANDREDGDVVSAAVYAAAHAFMAGRTYAILNDSLDTFPVLMGQEELTDYLTFLRERGSHE